MNQTERRKGRQNVYYVGCFVLIAVFVTIILFAVLPRKEPMISQYYTHTPSTSSEKQKMERNAMMEHITGSDNGHKWLEASYDARVSLCKDIASRISKHDWKYYYEAVDNFYKTTDPNILSQKIATISAMASVMPSEEKQRKTLSDAVSKGEISFRDLEIFNYFQSRWDFYESRDGEYIAETHDNIVLSETAKKFGISKDKAHIVFSKVNKIKLGLEPKERVVLDTRNVHVDVSIKDIRLLSRNVLGVTVENRTKKQVILPTINLSCLLYKGDAQVGYSCGITIWAKNLGYSETKTYESAPLSFDFDAVQITGYINIDKMKASGLKSKIQASNDPGETVIPIIRVENRKVK